jgi:hypothetical protein
MRTGLTALTILFAAVTPGVCAGAGPALKSSTVGVNLVAVVNERLSLVPSISSVNFSVRPRAVTDASQPLALTTSWNLDSSRSGVVVWAYFSDPGGALAAADGAGNGRISAAEVLGRVKTGTPRLYTQFSGMATPDGSGLEIFRQRLTPGVGHLSSRSDTIEMRIDLTDQPRIVAGPYEGDLTLVAQAY